MREYFNLCMIHNHLKNYRWCELDNSAQYQAMYDMLEWSVDVFAHIIGADSHNVDAPMIRANFAVVMSRCMTRVMVEYINAYGVDLPAEELLYVVNALLVAITVTNTDLLPSAKNMSEMSYGNIDAPETGRVLRSVMNLVVADEISLVF